MANYASLSRKQLKALHAFLEKQMPESIDELVEQIGQEDAFTLTLLKSRFDEQVAKEAQVS